MIDSISTAIEVAHRTGKVFLVLVEIHEPNGFYQVITVPSSRIRSRLEKYLPNARAARLIDDTIEIFGKVHLLGYQDRSEFGATKTLYRRLIGPEVQASLNLKIGALSPPNGVSISFSHSPANGVMETPSDFEIPTSIQDLVKRISTLEVADWFR